MDDAGLAQLQEHLELGLALDQRQMAQILTVELQQVERPQADVAALVARQPVEVDAPGAGLDELAVQHERLRRQLGNTGRDGREAPGHVVAVPAVKGDLGPNFDSLATPAVELGLMQPLLACRRLADFAGNAGIDEWKGRGHGTDIAQAQRASIDARRLHAYRMLIHGRGAAVCEKRISAGALIDRRLAKPERATCCSPLLGVGA